MKNKTLVLKIGGSLLYDENLVFNLEITKKICDWYSSQNIYQKCVFVVGGGKISRFLVEQVRGEITQDSCRHRIGMKMTQVNAAVVYGLLNDIDAKYFDCSDTLISEMKGKEKGLSVIGGTKIGGSTDIIAAEIAFALGVNCVHKISNITNIYTENPTTNPNATPIENISWDEYKAIFEGVFKDGHKPGMNIPIDFGCASFCKEKGIAFRVSGGKNLYEMDMGSVLEAGTLVT